MWDSEIELTGKLGLVIGRYYLLGLDMNIADYDGRTALHVAAAEGQEQAVRFLLEMCNVNVYTKDRWNTV